VKTTYELHLRRKAEKELRALDDRTLARIAAALSSLANEPRPEGSKKLTGENNVWRIRVGTWRIVYSIDDSSRTVSIDRIRHRKDVYRPS
jgi:mRNA interferase RelE/StbE